MALAMDRHRIQLPDQAQAPHHYAVNFSRHHNKNQTTPTTTSAAITSPSQRPPLITMNGEEMPVTAEDMGAPIAGWATPSSHSLSHVPSHDAYSYCPGEGFDSTLPPWDTPSMGMQTPSETMSRPVSTHQDFFPMATFEDGHSKFGGIGSALTLPSEPWMAKLSEDNLAFHGLDADMGIGQAFTSDEAIPVLDLRYPTSQMDPDSMSFEPTFDPRRISGSSFTMSTSGAMSDVPPYEDFSAALSEAPSFASDYPPPSNRNSMLSSTQLSPVASPRMAPHHRTELARTHSRGRGTSPSPRPPMRSAPYHVDSSSRNKRWSTGSYATTPSRRPSPFVYNNAQDSFSSRMPSRNSSPPVSHNQMALNFGNIPTPASNPFLTSHPPPFRNSMILPSQLPSQGFCTEPHQLEPPAPLLSQGLFRMLQSNAEPHSLHSHYHDVADPPDLFASLHEEQIPPPPEDMNPEDPDMIPHEQELRFEGDLYTPRWVRGHGNKREGWCGICKPGRWLVLKNSAYWYDKSFTHGISAATGSPFQEPHEYRRMDGNPDVWEGLCGSCNDWIALVSSKKKGTTWFRHAYKCHTHPKVKDVPKRRRESSNARALAASHTAKPKVEPQRPVTPQVSSAPGSLSTTPSEVPVPPIPAEHHQVPPVPSNQDAPHDAFGHQYGGEFANMI